MSSVKQCRTYSERAIVFGFALIFILFMNINGFALGGSGLNLVFNIYTWIGFSFFLFISALLLGIFHKIKLSKYSLLMLGSLTLILVPALYNGTVFTPANYQVIFSIVGAYYFFSIISQYSSASFKHKILLTLYVSTLIQTLWGLVQYYFIFENGPLFFTAEETTMPYGVFSQKNVFPTYLAMGSLLSLFFLANAKKKSKWLVVSTFAVVILNAHLSMLAEAKTGRVVPLIAVCSYLIFCIYHHKMKAIGVSLIFIVIVTSFTPKQWFDIRPNQEVDAPVGIESFGIRPTMYRIALEMIADKPILGIGMGNLPREFNIRKSKDEDRDFSQRPKAVSMHIHSEPLQWMIELGVVSGFAFILIFYIWIRGLIKGELDASILLISLPLVGHCLLEYPFYHSSPHLLAFAAILAMAYKGPSKSYRFPASLGGIIVAAGAILSYRLMVFMFSAIASINTMVEYRAGNKADEALLYSVTPSPMLERLFEHEKFQWKLKRGVESGSISQDTVFDYIAFLEKTRYEWPEPIIYVQLAEMYMVSGQNQQAFLVMEEANAFFPWDAKVVQFYQQLYAKYQNK